jgi:hypothetical protein
MFKNENLEPTPPQTPPGSTIFPSHVPKQPEKSIRAVKKASQAGLEPAAFG